MNDDDKTLLPPSSQQASTGASGAQNSVPSSAIPTQPRILLPGQDNVTPTTYSDHTIPLALNATTNNGSTQQASTAPNAAPKSEPLGASILYPVIPAAYPSNVQSPHMPPRSKGKARLSRNAALIALPIVIAVGAVVLALLVAPVAASWPMKREVKIAAGEKTAQPTQTGQVAAPTSVPSTMPTMPATSMNSVSDGSVSLTPDRLNVQNDCQPDNEYRCTVTLTLAPDADNSTSWAASIDGVDHRIQPRAGRLKPGQHQQIIIYLYENCPIDAELNIAMRHQHLNIPLRCSQ